VYGRKIQWQAAKICRLAAAAEPARVRPGSHDRRHRKNLGGKQAFLPDEPKLDCSEGTGKTALVRAAAVGYIFRPLTEVQRC
jgi:hypothetical protein